MWSGDEESLAEVLAEDLAEDPAPDLPDSHGSPHEDRQEIRPRDHREVLLSSDSGLPCQQESLRRSGDHPLQEVVDHEISSFDTSSCESRMRNKIAGFITHLMNRIQKGAVRGISLKLQEEERERRLDFVPERSAIELDTIVVDQDTMNMLESINFKDMQGIQVANVRA